VDVSPKDQFSYYVNATLYNLKPTDRTRKLKYPMHLSPSSKVQYFDPEQPFSIMNLASNPMFIMIGVSALMYFCVQNMPKQDPEAMKEMNEQMKNMRL